ncbi:hypothetical protein D9M71_742800 [compost metagenome]
MSLRGRVRNFHFVDVIQRFVDLVKCVTITRCAQRPEAINLIEDIGDRKYMKMVTVSGEHLLRYLLDQALNSRVNSFIDKAKRTCVHFSS